MSDKPVPPTDKRLRDARADGQVARSEVLAALIVSALTTEAVFACVGTGIEHWLILSQAVFSRLQAPDRLETVPTLIEHAVGLIAIATGMVTAVAAIAAIIAAWICGGVSFTPKVIRPSLKRLNAVHHLKALVGKKHLVAVALAMMAAGVVGVVAYWQLRARIPLVTTMIEWQSLSFDRHAGIAALQEVIRIVLTALLVPTALAAIVARRHHRQGLRMSHRELKNELKQTTGNPAMRARQRMALDEAAPPSPARNTGGKRVLIVNPEHFAVLLHYTGDPSEPPIVVDKAIDGAAMHMASAALRDRVAVFQFRPLARHLYRHGEPQSAIPADCYRAVAIVYRIVDEIETLDDRPNEPIEIDDSAFGP